MNVKLRRDAWHGRIQRWTFPSGPPSFQNFCPYFWLTIFCLTAIPFTLLAKLVVAGFMLFVAAASRMYVLLDKHLLSHVDVWLEKRMQKKTTDAVTSMTSDRALQIQRLYEYNWGPRFPVGFTAEESRLNAKLGWKARSRLFVLLVAWKKEHPNWEQMLEDAWTSRLARVEEHERVLQTEKERCQVAARKRQRMFSFIAQYTKYVMVLPALVVTGGIGYLIYLGISFIVSSWHLIQWSFILEVLGYIVVIVTGIAAGIAVVIFLSKLQDGVIKRPLARLGQDVADTAGPSMGALGRFFGFFWSYIKAAKQNHCPHIEWVDDEEEMS